LASFDACKGADILTHVPFTLALNNLLSHGSDATLRKLLFTFEINFYIASGARSTHVAALPQFGLPTKKILTVTKLNSLASRQKNRGQQRAGLLLAAAGAWVGLLTFLGRFDTKKMGV
jgi:hypothetical protein